MNKQFNWHRILTGELNRVRFIERYAGVPHVHKEDVAQHSFYTSIYAMLLTTELKAAGVSVDTTKVLTRALMHDLEESMTGDLLRSVKHGHPGLKEAMDDAGQKLLDVMVENMFSPGRDARKEIIKAFLMSSWREAKDNSLEGSVVSLADLLGVVSYAHIEYTLGNKHASSIRKEIIDGLKQWTGKHTKSDAGHELLCLIVNDVMATIGLDVKR